MTDQQLQQRLDKLKLESLGDRWRSLYGNLCQKMERDCRFDDVILKNNASHSMSLRRPNEYILPRARTNRLLNTAVSGAAKFLNSLDSSRNERMGQTNLQEQPTTTTSQNTLLNTNLAALEESINLCLEL